MCLTWFTCSNGQRRNLRNLMKGLLYRVINHRLKQGLKANQCRRPSGNSGAERNGGHWSLQGRHRGIRYHTRHLWRCWAEWSRGHGHSEKADNRECETARRTIEQNNACIRHQCPLWAHGRELGYGESEARPSPGSEKLRKTLTFANELDTNSWIIRQWWMLSSQALKCREEFGH